MAQQQQLKHESIMVSLPSTEQIHMTRLYLDKENLGAPVFMLHSTLQDSSTFYVDDGSGLACYMAKQGYDVYVADLRGKGKSWPRVTPFSQFGAHQLITEDIPALLDEIVSYRGPVPQIWVSHGWGGVLMCAYYARYGDAACPVARMVHFGARRLAADTGSSSRITHRFIWQRLFKWLLFFRGYVPAQSLRLGSANESAGNYRDYLAWSDHSQWCDTVDDFSYGEAIQQQQLPPSFYFAAKGDGGYGHPDDVRHFMQELGPHDGRMMVLSRQGGNLRDYSHLDMLLHSDCEQDHFPLLLDWLQE